MIMAFWQELSDVMIRPLRNLPWSIVQQIWDPLDDCDVVIDTGLSLFNWIGENVQISELAKEMDNSILFMSFSSR